MLFRLGKLVRTVYLRPSWFRPGCGWKRRRRLDTVAIRRSVAQCHITMINLSFCPLSDCLHK